VPGTPVQAQSKIKEKHSDAPSPTGNKGCSRVRITQQLLILNEVENRQKGRGENKQSR